jgi:competence protein ComEC
MGFLIDMIDVGQGDATLLTLDTPSRTYTVLVDAGSGSSGERVADFIHTNASGNLDVAIGTHLDNDHIGGFKVIFERCKVGGFLLNLPPDMKHTLNKLHYQRIIEHKKSGLVWDVLEKSLKTAEDLISVLASIGISPSTIVAGDSVTLGNITLNVLNPTPQRLQVAWEELEEDESSTTQLLRELAKSLGTEAPETSAENNSSVVLEISYNGQPYALLPGDAGADVLKEVTQGRKYPFLKVPHHGSKSGLDEELIKQLSPSTAYISVGDNGYGHPAGEILDLLKETNVRTFCSQRTRYCRKDCPSGGFGSLCHRVDRDFRSNSTPVDPAKCVNNQK